MTENGECETQEEFDELCEQMQEDFDTSFEEFIENSTDGVSCVNSDQLNALACRASPSLRYFVQTICDALEAWDAQDIIEEEMFSRGWMRVKK